MVAAPRTEYVYQPLHYHQTEITKDIPSYDFKQDRNNILVCDVSFWKSKLIGFIDTRV